MKQAFRTIARMPGLAAVVVISLGVGIGVNTAVFSWIQALVLKPIPGVDGSASFYNVEIDKILVVHDEIDLDFGVVRLKNGGGHGGHNGLRSVTEQLGGGGFARLRMGVGRDPNKPPGSKDAAAWVLADFPSAQAPIVDAMISAGCEDTETTLALGIVAAMNKHNARSNLATS